MSLTAKLNSIEPAELARCLFEVSSDALFVFDPREMSLLDANPNALEMTRLPRHELLERRLFELFDAEAGEPLNELMEACQHAQSFRASTTFLLRREADESVSVNVTVTPLCGDRQLLGLIAVHAVREPASAQTKSEELLRASEVKYRSLVEHAPVCIYSVDLSGRLSSINPAGLKIAAVDNASEMIGHEFLSFVQDHERARVENLLKQAFQGHASSFELTSLVNGDPRLFSNSFIPVFADDGAVTAITGAARDITESHKLMSRLRIQDLAIKSAEVGITIIDASGEGAAIIECNPAFERMTGFTRAEVIGKNCRFLQAGDTDQDGVSSLRAAMAQGRECTAVVRNYRKDGDLFWDEVRIAPVYDPSGHISHFVGFQNDISERVEMQRKLLESESRFRTIFEQAAVGVALIDTQTGQFVRVNQKYCQLIGYCQDEMVERTFVDITFPEDLEDDLANMRRLHAGEISEFTMEKRLIRKNGFLLWVKLNVSPTWRPGTKPEFHIAIIEDITARKTTEQELAASRQALENAQTRAGLGSWEFYPGRSQAIWSPEMFRLYNRDPASGVPLTIEDFLKLVHPEDCALVMGFHRLVWETDDPIPNFDLRTNPANGPLRWLDASVTRVPCDDCCEGFYVAGTVLDITQRKKAEQAVEQSERKFRTLCTHAPMGIFLTDVDGSFSYMNETGCKIIGQSADESAGSGWVEALHPKDRERVTEAWTTCVETSGLFDVETQFLHSNGRVVWARARANARYDDSGNIVGYVGSLVDATRQRNTMEELVESEHRYRSLVDSAPEGIVVLDVDAGRFVEFNESALEIFKCDAETLSDSGPWDFSPEFQPNGFESIDAAQDFIGRALAGDIVVSEWTHRDTSGREFPCEVRLTCFLEEGRRLVRGSITDITQRKTAEQQLRMTRFAVESTLDAMFVIDRDGNFVDVNEIACQRLGYTRQELLKMGMPDVNPNYPLNQWREHWDEIKTRGKLVFESEHMRRDSSRLPVEISKSYFQFEGNEYAFAFVRDITERKQAETQLRITQAAIDQNHGAIVRINSQGRFTYVNESICEHLGYSREELLAMHVWDVDPNWLRETWVSDWLRVKTAGSSTFRTAHKKKDGTIFPAEVTSNYFHMGGEEFLFAFSHDLTERKLAEDTLRERENQLAHVSRLSTMGEMVAGIAHEVNQPLYSIVNFSKAVNNTLRDPAGCDIQQIAGWNRQIGTAANRAGEIIKRLRGFVSQQPTHRTAVNVCNLIADAIEFVRYDANRGRVALNFALLEEGVEVNVDRVQAQQVLVNLLMNAIEAMDADTCTNREVVVAVTHGDDQVEISVSDTGSGLPDQRQTSIFDAFVSTKPGGMGMGLAISQTIVESLHGRLWASNNEQGGATFHFTLPRISEVKTNVS